MTADTVPDTVAVIGGGAVGTTLAGDLASEGVDVTLFERDTIASGASGRAAGICYDAYTDRRDVEIASRAIERFRDLADSFRAVPYVLLAREGDRQQADAIESLAEQMASRGVDVDLVDGEMLGTEFPDLVTDDVSVAAITRTAGVLDPKAFTEAMAERARTAGATLRTETTASMDGPRTIQAGDAGGTFDAVVVAAGPETGRIVADADVKLALQCYRAQALVTEPLDVDVPTVFDATNHYYLRPHESGILLGDGVDTDVEPGEDNGTADEAFLATGCDHLETAVGVEAAVDRAWSGLCTATPDRDPLVGPVTDGLFVATGWHGHGLMRAPAIAEALAAQLLGSEQIAGFEPARFSGDEQFEPVEGMTLDGE
jgi:sarcosine oxidase subunit beta